MRPSSILRHSGIQAKYDEIRKKVAAAVAARIGSPRPSRMTRCAPAAFCHDLDAGSV